MAFCPNCGAQVTGAFCPSCGTNVAAAAAGAASGTSPGTGPIGAGAGPVGAGAAYAPPPPIATAAGMSENVAGALCYLAGLVTGVIFLVIAPYNQNKFVRFHAFQAIFGHLAIIVLWVAYVVVGGVLAAVTHGIGFLLFPIFGLLIFLLWLYMMYTAYNYKKFKLPIVGDLAEKQA